MIRITILLLLFTATSSIAQTKITWEDLRDVKFTDKYSEELDAYYYHAEFGPTVKAMDGKEVMLKGYIISINPKNGVYILSRSPFASCFFCGKEGPESIVELKLKPGHPKYKTDQVATMVGVLELNNEDIYQCNYLLQEAEEYEE